MVKIKLNSFRVKHSPCKSAHEEDINASFNGGAKLWENDELVMKALKVYGKFPRPHAFGEISRVCKLSNLRKSRYFHEKMMRNNPYEDKIRKLIAEEGEEAYPFFRIFFDEYKTKKERQKLMNHADDNSATSNDNNSAIVDNYSDYSACYDTGVKDEEIYEAPDNDEDDHEHYDDNGRCMNDTEPFKPSNGTESNQILPLIDSNTHYLENLELKLKILNTEKETMVSYFQTFTTVIEGLKSQINQAKSGQVIENEKGNQFKFSHDDLNDVKSLEKLGAQFNELKHNFDRQSFELRQFTKEQASLKEDLKLTRNYVNVENRKLQEELDECRSQLSIKDEQIGELKRRLNESTSLNRANTAKHLAIKSNSNMAQNKLSELNESMDLLFSQIQNLN